MKANLPIIISPRPSMKRSASFIDNDYDELGGFSRKQAKKHSVIELSGNIPCLRCLKGMLTPGDDIAKFICVSKEGLGHTSRCFRCQTQHCRCDAVPKEIADEAQAVQQAVVRIQNGEIVDDFNLIVGACRAALKLPAAKLTVEELPQSTLGDFASFFRRPARQVAIAAAPRIAYQAAFEAGPIVFDKSSPPCSQGTPQPSPKKEKDQAPGEPPYVSTSFSLISQGEDETPNLKGELAALEVSQLELSKKITQLEQEVSEMGREKIELYGVIGSLSKELSEMHHFDAKKDLRKERMSLEERQCNLSKLVAEKEKEVDALEAEKAVKQVRIDRVNKQLGEI